MSEPLISNNILSTERYFKFGMFFLLFLLLVFDRDMALVYALMIAGDFMWYRMDKKVQFHLRARKSDIIRSALFAIIGAVIFLTISGFVMKTMGVVDTSFQAILNLYATSTPILAGNQYLTLIGWGILIPLIETSFFFGRVLEGFKSFVTRQRGNGFSLNKLSVKTAIVFTFVAGAFALFHITAKGLSSTPLMLTFIFAIISCYLVAKEKQLAGAVILHVIVNSLAVAISFGWL